MKQLFTFLLVAISSILLAQAPQSIPYQAIVRNTDGSVMASTSITMTFKIHDVSAAGTVVYEETHSTTSNTQGLVSLNVGVGTAVTGTFASINWGSGAKFLHVLMNTGSGNVDLGTQQMMSVPYALYADNCGEVFRVSSNGDSLFLGSNNYVIIPGLSAINGTQSNIGANLLPGNDTCDDQFISVSDCGGDTSMIYLGESYNLVEVEGQCWFAENLSTDKYRNGDLITSDLGELAWATTSSGAFVLYNNDVANEAIYGKLYNWYAAVDSRGICPQGWHVPTECDWMFLEKALGMSPWVLEAVGDRGTNQGGALKAVTGWQGTNFGAQNSTGLTILPGGYVDFEFQLPYSKGGKGYFWSSSEASANSASARILDSGKSSINRSILYKNNGFSIRCIKD